MNSCDESYGQWEVLERELEDLRQACEATQQQWTDDFHTALDNIAQPDLCIRNLVKGHKGFNTFLECREEYDALFSDEWKRAMDDLWDCIEQHGHHDGI